MLPKYQFRVLERVKRHNILFMFDMLCFLATTLVYYMLCLRASSAMPVRESFPRFAVNVLVQLILVFGLRLVFGSYRNVWRYSNTAAYLNIVIADTIAGVMTLFVIRFMNHFYSGLYFGIWQAVSIGACNALLTLSSRFFYAILYKRSTAPKNSSEKKPAVIVGAGRLGIYLLGDLTNNPNSEFEPMFFVDKNPEKVGNKVHELFVYDAETAAHLIKRLKISYVLIAIANNEQDELAALFRYYKDLGCTVRIFNSLSDGKTELRDISIEDLLYRKELHIIDEKTHAFYRGKTVLITGGGGSIGSEICRQLALCGVYRIVIFDVYENNAYDIQQELLRKNYPGIHICVEIGSVRDRKKLEQVFEAYRPEIVFHAAAHKHVPLMENNPEEAIKNNCAGTYYAADTAEKYGVQKFILISTDKAVNPTNIMGASKRFCEMIIQSRADSETSFAAVRFGNVLGSNGSVIPLFKKQIAEGGPVTVTDKRIIRYFMTIQEASQLVLKAGAMADKGDLFVLDMGKPVRIYDLAENMIRLSGMEPNVDIEIKEIGLRPGEKIYEELLVSSETLTKTEDELIFIEHEPARSREAVKSDLEHFLNAVENQSDLKKTFREIVNTYHDPEEVNSRAENA